MTASPPPTMTPPTNDRVAPLLDAIRSFLATRVLPLEPELLQREFRDLLPQLAALRAEVKAQGLWAPFLPASLGGLGLTLAEYAEVSAVLGTSPVGHYVFNCQAPDVGNMELLHAHGSPALQARWLKPLVAGEIRSCFSMTEPEYPGSNPVWMGTRAVRDGDQYVITGRKWFTSSADGAAFAIVMAVTDPDAPPHRRASQIVVPMDTPGVRLVRNVRIMGEAGSDWASHAEVHYEGVRVPVANRIGAEGDGFRLAMETLDNSRPITAVMAVGLGRAAMEHCLEYASTRQQFGKPIREFQAVQFMIADMAKDLQAARLLTYQSAWMLDAGEKNTLISSYAKCFAADMAMRVTTDAVQVYGGYGYIKEYPVEKLMRDAKLIQIYEGTSQIQRLVIAREILKGGA